MGLSYLRALTCRSENKWSGGADENRSPTQPYALVYVCAGNRGGWGCMSEATNGGGGGSGGSESFQLHLSCMSQEQARRVRAQSELWETNDVCSEGSGVTGL